MAPVRRVALRLGSCLTVLTLPAVAAAQLPTDPAVGPPVPRAVAVQQVENGPALGFDLKFVNIGGDDALFLGASGGYVFDGKLLVGGGTYLRIDRGYPRTDIFCSWEAFLYVIPVKSCSEQTVNEPGDFYGGLLVGWRALRSDRVSLGVGGLVGGGVAKIGWDGSQSVVNPVLLSMGSQSLADGTVLYDQGYFVFEPQVDVAVALGTHVVLAGSAGYRMIGFANGLDDNLKGMTASISFRVRVR